MAGLLPERAELLVGGLIVFVGRVGRCTSLCHTLQLVQSTVNLLEVDYAAALGPC